MSDDVDQRIAALALKPHPEGGHYRRIYASQLLVESRGVVRPALTAIQFLLRKNECSRWHRVDADETWHWQGGGVLQLQTYAPESQQLSTFMLGDLPQSEVLQVVPAGYWQRAWTISAYALVACTVSPGFIWEGFALLDAAPEIQRQLRALNATDVECSAEIISRAANVPLDLSSR